MNNICKNCSMPLEPGATFCKNCGTTVEFTPITAPHFDTTYEGPAVPTEPVQPVYTAPAADYVQPQPPVYNAPPVYTAPPVYNAPPVYTAPPIYNAAPPIYGQQPYGQPGFYGVPDKAINVCAMISFIGSIVSWFFLGKGYDILFAIAMLVVGIVGVVTHKSERQKFKWMGVTGIVISACQLVFWVIIFGLAAAIAASYY